MIVTESFQLLKPFDLFAELFRPFSTTALLQHFSAVFQE